MTGPSDAAPTRRDFLARAARASVVVVAPGWLALAAQKAASGPVAPARPADPSPLEPVLARMRAEGKPGILLRFPDEPELRQVLVDALSNALDHEGPEPDACEIFLDAVVACCEREVVDRAVPDGAPIENAILVDDRGCRVAADVIPWEAATDARELVSRLRRLLFGERLERLRARAEASLRAASPSTRRAFEAVLTDEPADWWKDARFLAPVVPALTLRRMVASDPPLARRLRFAVSALFQRHEEETIGPALPFGLRVTHPSFGTCAGRLHGFQTDVIGCGMGRPMPASRRFLGLLSR